MRGALLLAMVIVSGCVQAPVDAGPNGDRADGIVPDAPPPFVRRFVELDLRAINESITMGRPVVLPLGIGAADVAVRASWSSPRGEFAGAFDDGAEGGAALGAVNATELWAGSSINGSDEWRIIIPCESLQANGTRVHVSVSNFIRRTDPCGPETPPAAWDTPSDAVRRFVELDPRAVNDSATAGQSVILPVGIGASDVTVRLSSWEALGAPGAPCGGDCAWAGTGHFDEGVGGNVSIVARPTSLLAVATIDGFDESRTLQACGAPNADGTRVHVSYSNAYRGGDPCAQRRAG